MKAIELVGKLAIRTKPVSYGKNNLIGEEVKDYSHTTTPLKIVKVTDTHVIISYEGTKEEKIFGKELFILDERWNDDNWIDYKELIKMEEESDEK